MKGFVIFLVIVAAVVGTGLWMQTELRHTVEEGIAVLNDADEFCRLGEYALSQAAAEHFCKLWHEKEKLYFYLYKYDLLEEINRSTHKFLPLLEEMNLSEYRALCREISYQLSLLLDYEYFGARGVL